MAYSVAAIALLVAICVAFVCILAKNAADTGAARGFWIVSEQFKESAKVDQIVFYVGEKDGRGATDGYLIIAADGATKFNGPIQIAIAARGWWGGGGEYDLTLRGADGSGMPSKMVMILDSAAGGMTLKDARKKIIYARLFRDNQMSSYTLQVAAPAPPDDEIGGDESDAIGAAAAPGAAADDAI